MGKNEMSYYMYNLYFRKMLSLGSSVHWHDALEMLTGSRDISVEPLLDYYGPLLRE